MTAATGGNVEDPGNGSWYFKQTEEDGIFVKHNDSRLKSATGDLTGKVLNVEVWPSSVSKSRNKDQDVVMVS